MKKRLLGIVGILVILVSLITVPVSAGSSGTTALTGNPTSYVSIALNSTSIPLNLDPTSSPATNQSLGIILTCNDPFTVTVSDNTVRAASEQGYMGNYTNNVYGNQSTTSYTGINTTLSQFLTLTGTTNTTTSWYGSTQRILSGGYALYTGSAPVNNQLLAPNTFSQVVAYTDPVLPSGSTYRIDLLFTLTPT